MITDFIRSEVGGIVISILWGIGLAMLFRRVCTSRECITVYGPAPSDIRNKTMRYKNKCYVIEPKEASCKDVDVDILHVRQ
jgi:hypothetical protein